MHASFHIKNSDFRTTWSRLVLNKKIDKWECCSTNTHERKKNKAKDGNQKWQKKLIPPDFGPLVG